MYNPASNHSQFKYILTLIFLLPPLLELYPQVMVWPFSLGGRMGYTTQMPYPRMHQSQVLH